MKRLQIYLVTITACFFIATSCSKDESILNESEPETATLSFGAVLNDLVSKQQSSKQSLDDLPECTDDDASYVMIILSQDGSDVVGTEGAPFRVDLVPNEDFTVEVPELELTPGQYTLDYFAVHNSAGDLIWLAPNGGMFSSYFDNPLPMSIDLGAGVKKYVEVSVMCFDNRFVNEYGYLFFELDTVEAIEFCIFGNYCDETGRHYPAAFSVDVWTYFDGAPGSQLYSDLTNSVSMNNDGDYAGTTVCFALPDTAGLNEYYIEITLLNSDAYGNVTEEVIRSGVITDEEVRNLFDGADANDYYHFREGACNMDDSPNLFEPGNGGGNGGGGEQPGECDPNNPTADCDNDGVINSNDDCPSTPPGVDVNVRGCDDVRLPGQDVVVFNDVNVFDNGALKDPDNITLVQNLVSFNTAGSRNNGDVVLIDRGRSSPCAGGPCNDSAWALFRSTIEGEGFTLQNITSSSGSLTSIDPDVKIIFLVIPYIDYTIQEINTLKQFASEGGRIVFVGEHDGYYKRITVQNQFLLNMGAVLTNTGGQVDCGYTVIPETSNSDHPIMNGITDITMACASVIEPGPNDFVLWYDTSGNFALAGVARIDTTPINEFRTVTRNKKVVTSKEKVSNPNSTTGL